MTEDYDGEDWLVRWTDDAQGWGDAMDYDNHAEAFEAFKAGVEEQPHLTWTLKHYYDYKPDGFGGYHEPIEDGLLYWEGEDDPTNPLTEQIENMLSEMEAVE